MTPSSKVRSQSPGAYSDLPLPVEVRLGVRHVSLEEIQALQAGIVLPLDTRVGDALQLFVGNVQLALVELIQNEGRIDARILELREVNESDASAIAGELEQSYES